MASIAKSKTDTLHRLGGIPTSELVKEILRRGGANLYGNPSAYEEWWLRISFDSMRQRDRPDSPISNPKHWSGNVGISTE